MIFGWVTDATVIVMGRTGTERSCRDSEDYEHGYVRRLSS